MKIKNFLPLLLIIATNSVISAQWSVKTTLAGSYYLIAATHFIDNNIGFIGGGAPTIGDSSRIKKTTDGGVSWTNVATVNSTVKDIFFVSPTLGFAVGSGGLIAKTTDGGNTWSSQYYINPNTSTPEAFESIYFVDQNTGYIAGGFYEMWVLKTTDGGVSWNPLTMPSYFQRLKSVFFTSVSTGYVVGGDASGGGTGRIYKTINGGSTWDTLSSGISSNYFNDIVFSDANNGMIACVNNGTLLKTANAGSTWTPVTNPTTSEVTEFSFVNASLGYASILSGKIIKTIDGGSTWTLDATLTPTMSAAYSISVPSSSFGCAGGLLGMYATMGTTGINDLDFNNEFLVYPNPTNGKFVINIKQDFKNIKVSITDINGKEVYKNRYETGNIELNLQNKPAGIYFVKVQTESTSSVIKLIKE